MNFDEQGNTIFHKVHEIRDSFRVAQHLRRQVLGDWKD